MILWGVVFYMSRAYGYGCFWWLDVLIVECGLVALLVIFVCVCARACKGGQDVKLVIVGDLVVCAYWWLANLNLGLMSDVYVLEFIMNMPMTYYMGFGAGLMIILGVCG